MRYLISRRADDFITAREMVQAAAVLVASDTKVFAKGTWRDETGELVFCGGGCLVSKILNKYVRADVDGVTLQMKPHIGASAESWLEIQITF